MQCACFALVNLTSIAKGWPRSGDRKTLVLEKLGAPLLQARHKRLVAVALGVL
jgi:hypothetical protein